MKKSSNYIKLEFLSRSTNEGFARSAVAAFASQLDPTLDELGDIKTAVSEAVTNAIVHAYPDTLGKIVVRVRLLDGGVLEIAVYDWGRGIADVEKAREPLFTTGGEERSGMGFTIMESFMDTLKGPLPPGQGTVVTMRKKDRAARGPRMSSRDLCPARSGAERRRGSRRACTAGEYRPDLGRRAPLQWPRREDGRTSISSAASDF